MHIILLYNKLYNKLTKEDFYACSKLFNYTRESEVLL